MLCLLHFLRTTHYAGPTSKRDDFFFYFFESFFQNVDLIAVIVELSMK